MRNLVTLTIAAMILAGCGGGSPLFPQSGAGIPAPPGIITPDSTRTVSHWKTSFVYNGVTYTVKMVGTNPATGGVTTTVANEIIPVKLVFSDATTLDGSVQTSTLTASPLYVKATYASGKTQYADAVTRAEFWNFTRSESYHVLLAAPTIESTVTVPVPTADGYTKTSGGITTGYVTYAWFIQTIEPQILLQLGIDSKSLAIFLTDRTLVLEPSGFCCFNGYHNSFAMTVSGVSETFTTAWASVSANSITHMGHEVSEWMNDPFYTNNVPPWVVPNKTSCGGNKLEVGDPTSKIIFTVNGYQVEDMTFYSWFARTVPSIGISGQYDMLGQLTGPAAVCT